MDSPFGYDLEIHIDNQCRQGHTEKKISGKYGCICQFFGNSHIRAVQYETAHEIGNRNRYRTFFIFIFSVLHISDYKSNGCKNQNAGKFYNNGTIPAEPATTPLFPPAPVFLKNCLIGLPKNDIAIDLSVAISPGHSGCLKRIIGKQAK